jgi:hypothetical protein
MLSRIPAVTEVPPFSASANAILDKLCTPEGCTPELAMRVRPAATTCTVFCLAGWLGTCSTPVLGGWRIADPHRNPCTAAGQGH